MVNLEIKIIQGHGKSDQEKSHKRPQGRHAGRLDDHDTYKEEIGCIKSRELAGHDNTKKNEKIHGKEREHKVKPLKDKEGEKEEKAMREEKKESFPIIKLTEKIPQKALECHGKHNRAAIQYGEKGNIEPRLEFKSRFPHKWLIMKSAHAHPYALEKNKNIQSALIRNICLP
jgi:hypothetical protein